MAASSPASVPRAVNSTARPCTILRRRAPSVCRIALSKRRSSLVTWIAASSTVMPASSVNRNTYCTAMEARSMIMRTWLRITSRSSSVTPGNSRTKLDSMRRFAGGM